MYVYTCFLNDSYVYLIIHNKGVLMRQCANCMNKYEKDNFYPTRKKNGVIRYDCYCKPCRKEINKQYLQSFKGKQAQAKYRQSDKGKESIKRSQVKYFLSTKGKETRSRVMKRYFQSVRGKEALRRAMKKWLLKKKNGKGLAS